MSRRRHVATCALSFVAGAVVPTPAWFLLVGQPVLAVQTSLLLTSGVALSAALAPWWTDWLEDLD